MTFGMMIVRAVSGLYKAANFRSRNLNRNLHLNWIDANTSIDVNFYHKGQDKRQVVVQHDKLSSLAESEKLKYYWKAKLERLISLL
jgi:hypothetical protein